MGITRKITKNINAPVEMKIVTKFKTVQLCRNVNLVMPNFHCTPTSELLPEEYYTKWGVLRFLLASRPWDVYSALHKAAQHRGHFSEMHCGAFPTCLLDFFLKERRARRRNGTEADLALICSQGPPAFAICAWSTSTVSTAQGSSKARCG